MSGAASTDTGKGVSVVGSGPSLFVVFGPDLSLAVSVRGTVRVVGYARLAPPGPCGGKGVVAPTGASVARSLSVTLLPSSVRSSASMSIGHAGSVMTTVGSVSALAVRRSG